MKKKKLGEVLRDRGEITSEDLFVAIAEQQGKMMHLGELMLERGFVEKEALAAALEEISHIPYLDCSEVVPNPEAIKFVQRAAAERYCALPIRVEQGRLVVAMAAPQDLTVLGDLRFTTGLEISPRLSFRSEIKKAIAKYYDGVQGKSNPGWMIRTRRYLKKWNSFRPALASLIKKPFKKCRPICGKEKRLRYG